MTGSCSARTESTKWDVSMQCMLGLLDVLAAVVGSYAVSKMCVLYLTAILERSNGAGIIFRILFG